MVVGEFGMGDRFCPSGGFTSTKDSEVRFYLLVYPFGLSVRLQVIGGREGEIVLEDASKFLGQFGGKLGSMIGDDF